MNREGIILLFEGHLDEKTANSLLSVYIRAASRRLSRAGREENASKRMFRQSRFAGIIRTR